MHTAVAEPTVVAMFGFFSASGTSWPLSLLPKTFGVFFSGLGLS